MRDVGIDVLPRSWRLEQIGDVVAEAQPGFACGERDEKGTVQLRMNNVGTTGQFDWKNYVRVPVENEQRSRYRLEPGDVVFNNTNSADLVGKSACFNGHKEPVVYSNHFTRIRTNPNLCDPAFLSFWLNHLWQSSLFSRICDRWVGQSAVKFDKLRKIEIPLPPLAEQQRVATILKTKIAAIERARKASMTRLAAARALPAAFLRELFEGADVMRQPTVTLGEIMDLRREIVHPKDQPTGKAVFVGLEHIQSGTGKRIGGIEVDKAVLSGRKPRFCKNDIVYGYLRPYLNKVWVAEFEGLCSVDQYVYRVNDDVADVDYVAWYMRSPLYLSRAPVGVTPGQLPRIRIEEVAATEINLPPLNEQRMVVRDIDRKMAITEQLVQRVKDEARALDAFPASLLRQAFSGAL